MLGGGRNLLQNHAHVGDKLLDTFLDGGEVAGEMRGESHIVVAVFELARHAGNIFDYVVEHLLRLVNSIHHLADLILGNIGGLMLQIAVAHGHNRIAGLLQREGDVAHEASHNKHGQRNRKHAKAHAHAAENPAHDLGVGHGLVLVGLHGAGDFRSLFPHGGDQGFDFIMEFGNGLVHVGLDQAEHLRDIGFPLLYHLVIFLVGIVVHRVGIQEGLRLLVKVFDMGIDLRRFVGIIAGGHHAGHQAGGIVDLGTDGQERNECGGIVVEHIHILPVGQHAPYNQDSNGDGARKHYRPKGKDHAQFDFQIFHKKIPLTLQDWAAVCPSPGKIC